MPSIEYQSSFRQPSQSPTEYEHAYEQERGRWLRKRLLLYATAALAFNLLLSLPSLIVARNQVDAAAYVSIVGSIALAVTTIVVARRIRPSIADVLKTAFVYYVLAMFWAIGIAHFSLTSGNSAFREAIGSVNNRHHLQGETDTTNLRMGGAFPVLTISTGAADDREPTSRATPTTGPGSQMPTTRSSTRSASYLFNQDDASGQENQFAGIIYLSLLIKFFANHLIVCLFIPWTFRESIRPAGLILAGTGLVMSIDICIGEVHWLIPLFCLVGMVFAFLPGSAVCWWRYARFNKSFRLRFESKRFRQLEADLSSARNVHEACLARPTLSGPVRMNYVYEPMRQIGGDLLVTYPNTPGAAIRYVILLDVTGHGVAAALSVNRIIGEVERLLAENERQGVVQLAKSLNRYVYLTLAPRNLFVTGLLIEVDEAGSTFTVVNAGHPTAYRACAKTKSLDEIESSAMMLGVMSAADFDSDVQSIQLPFSSGDAIVGYTDGASEATNPEGKMLGSTAVKSIIAQSVSEVAEPMEWPDSVRNRVIAFRKSPPTDDTIIFSLWRQ